MLGKVVGAIAGRRVSKHISGISGPGGAVLGVAAAAVMRRMGPMGMVAAAVGGWALNRHFEKQAAKSDIVQTRQARRHGQSI